MNLWPVSISVFCKGKSPCGNQAVKMKMVNEGLGPSVQDADESEPSFKPPLRIFGKGLKGLIDSRKQDVEGDPFVG